MGGLLTMGNLARIAKVLALLFFVLPWVTVSCGEQTLTTMSGLNLALGQVQVNSTLPGGATPSSGTGANMFVVIGALLILAAIAATFILKGSKAAMAGAACSAGAAAVLLYAVLIDIKAKATSEIASSAGEAGGMNTQQITEMIRVNIEIGFWLCILALAAAVVLNVLAMRGPAPPAAAPPPAV